MTDNTVEIVKVQVAIMPKYAPALVYNHNRKRLSHQELSPGTKAALNGDLKGYFEAVWTPGQGYVIGARVAEPENW